MKGSVKTSAHILLVACIALAGCAVEGGPGSMRVSPRPVTRVDKVALLSLPTAINLDHIPGPDGVRVQALLFQIDRPEPVLVNGKLQFLLYDERVTPERLHTLKAYLVWTYSGAKLERHETRTLLGWGYAAELRWGSRPPRSRTISLAARYVPKRGPSVYSRPVLISMR